MQFIWGVINKLTTNNMDRVSVKNTNDKSLFDDFFCFC